MMRLFIIWKRYTVKVKPADIEPSKKTFRFPQAIAVFHLFLFAYVITCVIDVD